MGLLSDTILETITDRLAQRIAAVSTTPAPNVLAANTNGGLAQYLDAATGDASLQGALLAPLASIDRQVLAPNYYTMMNQLVANAGWTALFTAIGAYVKSADGGGYASFAAYIADVGGQLHPLVGEVCRAALTENCFTVGSTVAGVLPPLMDAVSFDRVYTGAQGTLVDDTTDAGDVGAADVTFLTADNDIIAFGSRHRFDTLLMDLSTVASADAEINAYYWNGTAWTALSLTDTTTGFSVNTGIITWTLPTDWEPCAYDMQGTPAVFDTAEEGEYYYVVIQRTADALAPAPTATWFKLIPEAITNSAGALYGVDQPPLAIVEITGVDTCTVTVVQDPDGRFEWPGIANNELKLVAITDFTNDITLTLAYTDQDGNAASDVHTAWAGAIAAGDTKNVTLDSGDTAIQGVLATTSVVTANTAGVFLVVANAYARAIAAK